MYELQPVQREHDRSSPEALRPDHREAHPRAPRDRLCCRPHPGADQLWTVLPPQTSRIWQVDRIRDFMRQAGVQVTTAHSGAYGGVNSRAQPIRKPFTFMGNLPNMKDFLDDKLTAEQRASCVPTQGAETTRSQEKSHFSSCANLRGGAARFRPCGVDHGHQPAHLRLREHLQAGLQP